MSMDNAGLTIRIGHDEALILFEMLADFYSQTTLEIKDSAERLALVRLHGALEQTLVGPFQPDYQILISSARTRLAAQAGDS